MCGKTYTPSEVTNKSKIHEVAAVGEVPPIGDRGGCIWVTMVGGGVPMHSKARLVLTYVGIWECLDYVPLVRYVSSTFLLLTQIQHPMMVDTNKNPVSE